MSEPALALEQARAGVIVPVAAKPAGRRDALVALRAGQLIVETSAPPEAGAANAAIARILARALGVPAAAVELTRGASSRRKRYLVAGLALADARRRLEAALGPARA